MTSEAFSKTQLARMHDVMAGHVASGRMPGLVTLMSRRGETHVDAIGTLAFGASAPMRRDTLFRIASISKPVTAAAAMMLVTLSWPLRLGARWRMVATARGCGACWLMPTMLAV